MELLFVGTGAADYETALSCTCVNCREIRAFAGRNVRTYASLLVDSHLLIDCGPTVPWRIAEAGADPAAVRSLLVTHAHFDHLDPEAVATLARAVSGPGGLRILGNELVLDTLNNSGLEASVELLEPGQSVSLGDIDVLVLPGHHNLENEQTLNYVISRDGVSVLYATDTAWPDGEWWELLSQVRLSAAVVEATFGPLDVTGHPDCLTNHMNWETCKRLVGELRQRDILGASAPAFATHLSLHWLPVHDKYTELVGGPDLQLAYDGLGVNA